MRWWLLVAGSVALFAPAHAQDQPAAATAAEAADEADGAPELLADDVAEALAEADDLLSPDELDALVAPVALYPDSLLTQVLVAATYPLDVMKADRFLDAHPDTPDKERANLAQGEDWDPSVQVLAGGFPDVIGRMADDIDWTEDLGDAMLAQTDDLLDSVQRLRSQAQAAGNLASNEAQTVETEAGSISIAPADPEVVYVPAYDPETVYTTPTTTAPVVYDDPGVSFGSVLTTGAIAFGSALLIDEIFDDDDWDNDYWYGPRSIDWDDDALYPGRINGDVDIDIKDNNVRIGDGDGRDRREERWNADRDRRDEARRNIENRQDSRTGDRAGRQDNRQGNRADREDNRQGNRADREDNRQGNRADRQDQRPDRRPAADRAGNDNRPGGGNDRPAIDRTGGDRAGGDRAGGDRAGGDRAGGGNRGDARTQAEAKLKARTGEGAGPVKAKASADGPKPKPKPTMDSVLKPTGHGPSHVDKSKARGAASAHKDVSPTAVKARAPSVSKPKAIAKPKAPATAKPKVPPRKPSGASSALHKPSGGAHRSHASSSRGKSSGGNLKRRR